MHRWKKICFVLSLLAGLTLLKVKAQTDTSRTTTSQTIIPIKPDQKTDLEKKRQKKTEKIAFVSCLFIVLSTIIIYNVRAK